MNRSGQLRLISGRRLVSPQGQGTRPTTARVREAVMNIVRPRMPNCRWLDLCSGSGVMGCEAIEHGAQSVTAVERDPRCARVCEENLRAVCGAEQGTAEFSVIRSELLRWLRQGWDASPFDLIYFDPPYEAGLYESALNELAHDGWLDQSGLLICEHRSDLMPPAGDAWVVVDQRRYGSSGLVLLSRRERCRHDGTGSMQPQTDPPT